MAREAGANKVIFASAAPPVQFPNVYGIDMPTRNELIAHGRSDEEVCREITADTLVYQDIEALKRSISDVNPALKNFEASCFDGLYVTGDISRDYLDRIEFARNHPKPADEDGHALAAEPEPGAGRLSRPHFNRHSTATQPASTHLDRRRQAGRRPCFHACRTSPDHEYLQTLRLHHHHPAQRPPEARSSTVRCTSRCTPRSPSATRMRASWRRCSRASSPATATAARATRPCRRWRTRSRRWKTALPRSASPPAWRRSARVVAGAAARGRSRGVVGLPVRQYQQPVANRRRCRASTSRWSTPPTSPSRGGADAGHPHRLRRDHRQSAHPGGRPGAHRRTVPRARHPVRGRQHDDLALPVPAENGATPAWWSTR